MEKYTKIYLSGSYIFFLVQHTFGNFIEMVTRSLHSADADSLCGEYLKWQLS
jgi:hypothetical protein